ncbi:MAG: cytochrome-c peroxidase [Planctomycetes bacterium]|nr:cytochrome-c peroxidase [Planctomycetota bacterium]MCB9885856.1 cytochrome-c peroxidase [Planctomycetota bacterium]
MHPLARSLPLLLGLLACCATAVVEPPDDAAAATLRAAYSQPPAAWPAATIDPGVAFVELGRAPAPTYPPANPWSKQKQALGHALFFDGRLSGTGQMACASCHDSNLGWSDGRPTSLGHGALALARNAPSILNSAHGRSFFWDGRAASLEDQALAVFENGREMATSGEALVAKLRSSRGYRAMFAAAFGDEEPTLPRALAALATFERAQASDGSSDFDRFLAGDRAALSDAQVRGLHLFRTKARCANCHHGPLLTDGGFHDLGLSYYGRKRQDLGRHAVTRDPADVGRFKTPSLRNVARTAPYMHNGLFDLPGIVNMYDAGMATLVPSPEQAQDPMFPTKSPLLQKLGLTAGEKKDLLAFLEALTERRRRVSAPQLPPLDDA